MITMTMGGVREQAKAPKDEIRSTIERLISLLRDREVVLINDVETIRHQKEKELQLQKDEIEFLLAGIRHVVLFSEAMMKEGSDTEIVARHHQVVARMATLTREREKAQLGPVTDAEIKFIGGVSQLDSMIRELGAVVATGISAEQSTIETPTESNSQINLTYSFKVILVDKKGNKISAKDRNKAVKGLAVEIAGPSKVKVHRFTSLDLVKFIPFFQKLKYFVCRPTLKRKAKKMKCLRLLLPRKLVSTKYL